MAPKGGRSSGGSSGGGGDGGGGGVSDSLWTAPIHFRGSHFTDPIARGTIILDGIVLFALLAIAIWAASIRKTSEGNQQIFKSYRFGLSMFAALIAFGINFAASIIRDVSTSVAAIYLLIENILENFAFFAQIFLLATIYYLVRYCYRGSNVKPYSKVVKWIHSIICVILLGLWIAALYFSITLEVHVILEDQSSRKLLKALNIEKKIAVAYGALFLYASVEVLIWAVTISLSLREQGNHDTIGVLLSGLVGFPLLIGSVWRLAISSASLHHKLSDKILFIDLLFVRVSTVIVYGGIVFIATRFEQDHNSAGVFMAPTGQNHLSPNQWQSQPLMYDGKTPQYQTGPIQHAFNGPPVGPPNGPFNGTGGTYWPNYGHQNGGYTPVSPEVGVNGAQPTSNQRGPVIDV